MTSRNFRFRSDQRGRRRGNPEPFLLRPVGKDYLWGGRRLNDEFAKGIDLEPLAETWECSTHPDGPSVVASGEYQGALLPNVLRVHPEYLGSRARAAGELPILVKLIDARLDLSVQVHPDDQYAAIHENGQRGKTELWYVLDAAPGARLIYGLYNETSPEALRAGIVDGSLEKYLQKVEIKKGDIFYIPAGMIHAIGAGALIAEIQESSNLTYRLYVYNRVDRNGKKRALDIEKALVVANLQGTPLPTQPMRVLQYRQGCASELLCRCPYFDVRRLLVNTERCRQLVRGSIEEMTFHVLLCIGGCGVLQTAANSSLQFFKGDCIFFPANAKPSFLHGMAEFLDIRG